MVRVHKKIAEIEQGKVSPTSINFAKLGFEAPADKYLESRRLELQPSSYTKEKQRLQQMFRGECSIGTLTSGLRRSEPR